MTTNNEYYKTIYEKVTGTTVTGTHTDNYYLHGIAESLCETTYSVAKCNSKYLKDIAESQCGTTYTGNHFNNYYLHDWAEEIAGETLPMNFDNHFLGIIADGIVATTSIKLKPITSQITYGSTVTLTVTLLDAERQPISGETVTIYEGETSKGTGTTGSDGEVDITVSGLNVGTHTLKATYDEYTSNNVTVTVNKIPISISLSVRSATLNYHDEVELFAHCDSLPSGTPIKIYDGSTVVTTVYKSNLSWDIILQEASIGTHVYCAVYEGDDTHTSSTSNEITVTIGKGNIVLDITTPMELEYGDSFEINGYLGTAYSQELTNQPIGLKIGNTIVETLYTDSNGEVTFTHTPVHTGNHSFQLVYAGNDTYKSGESTVVTKYVNKETSVLNVTSPATSSTTIPYTGTLIISGNLVDNDTPTPTPIADATINVYKNNVVIETMTTDSDGGFEGTISGSTLGEGISNLTIDYAGTENYTNCYEDKEVIVTNDYEAIDGYAEKYILSYADGDSTDLYAQLKDGLGNNIAKSDVTIYFRNGSTLLGTADTDSSGLATLTDGYVAAGVGNVQITVDDGSLLQETYVVEDCSYYNTAEVTKTNSNSSTIYDNNLSQSLSSKCEISFDIWSDNSIASEHRFFVLPKSLYSSGTSQPSYALYFDVASSKANIGKRENGSTIGMPASSLPSISLSTYHRVKFIKDGTTVEEYLDDTLLATQSMEWADNYSDYCLSMIRWNGSGTSKIKNVKFKKL